MTESELDVLWQRALHEAVTAGEPFTRYRFAALVRAEALEEAAQVCRAQARSWDTGRPVPMYGFAAELDLAAFAILALLEEPKA